MAFNLGDIFVTFKSNTDGLKKGLSEVQDMTNKTKGFSDKMSAYFDRSVGASKEFAVGVGIAGAAAVGFGAMTVKAFSESQDLIAQTNAVLKSTGGIAGVTADQVAKLATALESQTKFSDEDVRSVENLLLTFTSIGKDIFPQATSTVLDMAQALGEDTKSAAIQLGKALQDPVLGVTALRRVGVNFNQAQQDVIKNLVDTGQSAQAQQLIMAELTKEFGGSAKAAGETFSGKLAILKNKLNNVEEAIGGVLVDGLQPLVDGMLAWIDAAGGADGIMAKLTIAIQKIQPYLPAIAGAIIGGLVPAAIAATIAFGAWFLTMLPWFALGAAIALAIQHWNDITRVFGGTVQWIKDRFNDFKQVLEGIGNGVMVWMKDRLNDLKQAFSDVQDWLEKHKRTLEDIGTVIGIILIPTMVRLSIQAIVTAATMSAAATVSGVAWAAQAAVAGGAWLAQFVIMQVRAIATAIINTPAAIASGAAWAVAAGQAGLAWLLNFARMAAAALVAQAQLVASAVRAGIAWVIALGPVTLAIIAIGLAAFIVIRNWDTLRGWFSGLWNWFKGAAASVGGFIASVLSNAAWAVVGPFRAAFNAIASVWNNTVGRLSFKIPHWVPGIGGNQWSLPKIPYFATGVENFGGGLAYVHAGEMLVNLPKGTDVIPASKVGGGETIIVNIYKDADTDYFFSKMGRAQRLNASGLASQPGMVGN